MQIIAMAVPAQEGITRDNVTVRVDAVVYFRVVDPIKATINVQNYMFAVSQQAQTSLRSIIGQSEMDQLLSERDSVNRELRRIIDEPTEGPWGVRVERVGAQGRLAARQHEAIDVPAGRGRTGAPRQDHHTADGEYQASKRLAAAANVMAREPRRTAANGCCRQWSRSPRKRTARWSCQYRSSCSGFFDKFTPSTPAGDRKSAEGFGVARGLRR